MIWPESIPINRRKGFLLTLLMNLTVLPLLLSWTGLGILLFPVFFSVWKITTRWNTDRITRQLIWINARGCLLIMTPFVRFRRVGFKSDEIKLPCILVANHLSFRRFRGNTGQIVSGRLELGSDRLDESKDTRR